MPKDEDDDIPDWLKALLAIGIGAVAIAALTQILSGKTNTPPDKCPYCGSPIRKWARECPNCRKPLVWT
jgi:predicted amidophosphoribosyltransferase